MLPFALWRRLLGSASPGILESESFLIVSSQSCRATNGSSESWNSGSLSLEHIIFTSAYELIVLYSFFLFIDFY